MKKMGKVLVVVIILLSFMVAMPSIIGITQSFIGNVGVDNQDTEVYEAPLDENPNNNEKNENDGDNKDIDEDDGTEVNYDKDNDDSLDKDKDKDSESNVEEIVENSAKKIFLTFDDGPSNLTPEILKILDENQVKATFFTIGKNVEKNPQWVKQAYDEGHMVLPHTYTHEYSIYSTFETYYNDLELAKKSIEDVIDIEVPYIFRFPGGSSNQSSFKYGGQQFMPKLTEDVKEKGYYYIDWNVSSGDASPDYDNKEKMISNVIDGGKNKDFIVALFHDTSRNTKMAEILPDIILELKNQGYTFRTFRDITEDELNTMVQLKIANKPIIR